MQQDLESHSTMQRTTMQRGDAAHNATVARRLQEEDSLPLRARLRAKNGHLSTTPSGCPSGGGLEIARACVHRLCACARSWRRWAAEAPNHAVM